MINLSEYQATLYKELDTLGIKVYDDVPEDAKFPFITISDIQFQEASTHFKDLLDITQNIQVWSDKEGKKEANDISSNVINLLYGLNKKDINESQCLYKISLNQSSIKRVEGYYNGDLSFDLTIKEK